MCQKYTAGLLDQQTKSAFCLRRRYISEHAQKPLNRISYARIMLPLCYEWFLTGEMKKEIKKFIWKGD